MKTKKIYLVFGFLLPIFICSFPDLLKAQEVMNIHKNDGSVIAVPVAEIEMITFSGSALVNESTVRDVEGNVYRTVQIGQQLWMAENLKTTRFNNGAPIAQVTDNKDWYNMKSAAYCWYENNEAANKNRYGALYNFYAVDAQNLCPTGWHVSSDGDWQTLEAYMIANGYNASKGTTEMIGKSLAAKTGWNPSSGTVDVGSESLPEFRNKSGFSAVPGGFRTNNGAFSSPSGIGAYFWTSTEKNETHAWFKNLLNYRGTLEEIAQSKYFGCSVRCVKD